MAGAQHREYQHCGTCFNTLAHLRGHHRRTAAGAALRCHVTCRVSGWSEGSSQATVRGPQVIRELLLVKSIFQGQAASN